MLFIYLAVIMCGNVLSNNCYSFINEKKTQKENTKNYEYKKVSNDLSMSIRYQSMDNKIPQIGDTILIEIVLKNESKQKIAIPFASNEFSVSLYFKKISGSEIPKILKKLVVIDCWGHQSSGLLYKKDLRWLRSGEICKITRTIVPTVAGEGLIRVFYENEKTEVKLQNGENFLELQSEPISELWCGKFQEEIPIKIKSQSKKKIEDRIKKIVNQINNSKYTLREKEKILIESIKPPNSDAVLIMSLLLNRLQEKAETSLITMVAKEMYKMMKEEKVGLQYLERISFMKKNNKYNDIVQQYLLGTLLYVFERSSISIVLNRVTITTKYGGFFISPVKLSKIRKNIESFNDGLVKEKLKNVLDNMINSLSKQ